MNVRLISRTAVRLLALLFLILFSACETAHEATDQPVAQQRPQIQGAEPERGRELIREHGCGSCHQIPGIRAADGDVGPPLEDWADRQYIAGSLPNTPDNLIHWIRFPQAVEPGTVMPNLDIPVEDARDMAAYLYTLSSRGQLTDVFSTPRAVIGGLFSSAEESVGGTPVGEMAGGEVPDTGQQLEEQQGEGEQLVQQGEQIFSSRCAQCHGQNGEGQVGPALAGNQFVTSQDPAPVIDTVLHGRGQMPAFNNQLSNEQIAAVISYIRNAWGNSASTVSPGQIGSGQGNPQGTQGGQTGGDSQGQGGQSGQATPAQPSGQQGDETGQQPTQDQTGQTMQQTVTPQPTTGGQSGQADQGQDEGQGFIPPQVALVELYEWGADISDGTLPAGRVLFHVTNVGTRPFRFTIEGQGMELAFPVDIQVGHTRTLLADLRPGEYRIFSPLEDHAERGVHQEFTVREPEGSGLPGEQSGGQQGQPDQQTPTPRSQQQGGQQSQPTPTGQQGQPAQPTPTPGGQAQQGQQGQATATPGGQQPGEPPQSGAAQQVTIELTIQNRTFGDNTLSAPAGAQVVMNLTNRDSVPHNFALYNDSSASQAIFIGQIFTGPDQTVTYKFTAPAAPGTYYFRCDVHPYMNGEMRVE